MGRFEKTEKQASSTDLFGWLDALYTKKTPDGTPPIYMMHRFMASDPELAQYAAHYQLKLRDPHIIFKTWQALLPTARGAPRFQYVAPKKKPAEEALAARMREVLAEKRSTVESMIEITKLAGRLSDLYIEFGIEPPEDD